MEALNVEGWLMIVKVDCANDSNENSRGKRYKNISFLKGMVGKNVDLEVFITKIIINKWMLDILFVDLILF